uniref:Uncharacterized protein n=1 Tax=Oryza brachyantha TaxID=4533 RepID=J3ND96_ORYBR
MSMITARRFTSKALLLLTVSNHHIAIDLFNPILIKRSVSDHQESSYSIHPESTLNDRECTKLKQRKE